MKIAVLSDIHGNHFALNEVLLEAEKLEIDHLLVLGDLVGYYYHPDKVIELLSNWSYDLIKGNHEEMLLKILNNVIPLDQITKKYGRGHELAIQKIPDSTIQFLCNLPEKKELFFDGVKILMTHGSPWSSDFYVYPDANNDIISNFISCDYDFVCFGHTHYSCFFKTEHGVALNPGSVGQSRERGGMAYWAVINTQNKMTQIKATKYDTSQLKMDVLKNDPDILYNYNILDR